MSQKKPSRFTLMNTPTEENTPITIKGVRPGKAVARFRKKWAEANNIRRVVGTRIPFTMNSSRNYLRRNLQEAVEELQKNTRYNAQKVERDAVAAMGCAGGGCSKAQLKKMPKSGTANSNNNEPWYSNNSNSNINSNTRRKRGRLTLMSNNNVKKLLKKTKKKKQANVGGSRKKRRRRRRTRRIRHKKRRRRRR